MKSLSFLIPAFNDEMTIREQVIQCHAIGRKRTIPFEIVVLNDGSSDQTGHILSVLSKQIHELRTYSHAVNKGYGETIKELYYSARKEWLCTVPGDNQVQAVEIDKLISHEGNADIIVGWRKNRRETRLRQCQSFIYNNVINLFFHLGIHDVNSVRLMKSEILEHVVIRGTSAFVDAELMVKATYRGYRIKEIPIEHQSRFAGTGRGGGGKLNVIFPTIWEMMLLIMNRL